VKAGDTLSAVALAHYGNRSRRTIDAIFDANRDTLPDPDSLQIGMELTLPLIGQPIGSKGATASLVGSGGGEFSGGDSVSVDLAGRTRPRGGSPTRSLPVRTDRTGFRWYQVQKSDTYIGIARRQLGEASRWRELFELNKDRFPDPQRIREGVRIKIPTTRGSVTAERHP
jgi:nucleoid-associated protein YgaU